MKKEDLKTGMRVLIDFKNLDYDGCFGIVFKDIDLILFKDGGIDNISKLKADLLEVWELSIIGRNLMDFNAVTKRIYKKEDQPKKVIYTLNELADFMQEQMDKLNESVNKLK